MMCTVTSSINGLRARYGLGGRVVVPGKIRGAAPPAFARRRCRLAGPGHLPPAGPDPGAANPRNPFQFDGIEGPRDSVSGGQTI